MNEREIDYLLSQGWWIQVSPLATKNSGWVCGIYKQFKKSGNWVTEYTKTFGSPHECYDWASKTIKNHVK